MTADELLTVVAVGCVAVLCAVLLVGLSAPPTALELLGLGS